MMTLFSDIDPTLHENTLSHTSFTLLLDNHGHNDYRGAFFSFQLVVLGTITDAGGSSLDRSTIL